jgi:hypothetical protein
MDPLNLLINIIIVIVIFVSIMKRIQEVSKKGQDLRKPLSSPGETHPGKTAPVDDYEDVRRPITVFDEIPEEEKEVFEPVWDDKPNEEEIFEKKQTETYVPPQLRVPETIFVKPADISSEEIYKTEKSNIFDESIYKAHRNAGVLNREDFVPAYRLNLRGQDLVKGIILSEILGPPASMKTQRSF